MFLKMLIFIYMYIWQITIILFILKLSLRNKKFVKNLNINYRIWKLELRIGFEIVNKIPVTAGERYVNQQILIIHKAINK